MKLAQNQQAVVCTHYFPHSLHSVLWFYTNEKQGYCKIFLDSWLQHSWIRPAFQRLAQGHCDWPSFNIAAADNPRKLCLTCMCHESFESYKARVDSMSCLCQPFPCMHSHVLTLKLHFHHSQTQYHWLHPSVFQTGGNQKNQDCGHTVD
jgi:hypothetical protein